MPGSAPPSRPAPSPAPPSRASSSPGPAGPSCRWRWLPAPRSSSSALLLTLPSRAPHAEPGKPHHASDLLAGFRFIRRNPVFLAAITLDLLAVLLAGAVALLPVYAKDILQVGPAGLGWLRTAAVASAPC